jgi:hypothetical protein
VFKVEPVKNVPQFMNIYIQNVVATYWGISVVYDDLKNFVLKLGGQLL